jgi:hypothetical protein
MSLATFTCTRCGTLQAWQEDWKCYRCRGKIQQGTDVEVVAQAAAPGRSASRQLGLFVAAASLGAACFFMSAGSPRAPGWWLAGIAANVTALVLIVGHLRDRR